MAPGCANLTLEQRHSGCNSVKCRGREWDNEAELKSCSIFFIFMYDLQGFSCLCVLFPWFPVDLTPVSLVVHSVMSRTDTFHQPNPSDVWWA